MFWRICVFFSIFSLLSCVSVQEYNAHIERVIPSEVLRKEVDFVQEKLFLHHPDLDLYYSKQSIIKKMDSFKKTLLPMRPNDFSFEFSKVLSSLGHGHIHLSVLTQKLESKKKKQIKKTLSPFSLITLEGLGDRMILKKIQGGGINEQNIELISINGLKYKDFYHSFKGFSKGDGYIQTMDKYEIPKVYLPFLRRKFFATDSIVLELKKEDNIFYKTLTRKGNQPTAKKKKGGEKKPKIASGKDSPHQRKIKKYFGYDKKENDYSRKIFYPIKEDSTIAILRIRDFTRGNEKKGYAYIFDSIRRKKISHLILDIRGNGGGYISHTKHLYAHLSEGKIIADSVKVASKSAVGVLGFHNSNFWENILYFPGNLYHYVKGFLQTRKKGQEYFYYGKIGGKEIFPQKKYDGNLYILANGRTYSAASLLLSALVTNPKNIFIGEETAGDYNGTVAGLYRKYRLKNSKLNFSFGVMSIQTPVRRKILGRGVFPSLQKVKTFQEMLEGEDSEIQYVIEEIKKSKIQNENR